MPPQRVRGEVMEVKHPPDAAMIQQAVEAIAPKPLQIPPQALVRQSGEAALPEEGPLALYDGTECRIAGSRVRRGGRVTRKQGDLRRGEGCRRQRILPHVEEPVRSRCRRTLGQKCCVDQDASFPTVRR